MFTELPIHGKGEGIGIGEKEGGASSRGKESWILGEGGLR